MVACVPEASDRKYQRTSRRRPKRRRARRRAGGWTVKEREREGEKQVCCLEFAEERASERETSKEE